MRASFLLGLATVAACNGKTAIDGACVCSPVVEPVGNLGGTTTVIECSCTSSRAEPSRTLPTCSTQNVAGAPCMTDSTTDTGDSSVPTHVVGPAPECLDCPTGDGTDWVCGSQGWEAVGVYTCSQ
jgi:hypothetical protein